MPKKISTARKRLEKALEKHAEVVGSRTVSMKKVQRANAKLAAAVAGYAEAVEIKTGVPSPIVAGEYTGLDAATLASLRAERDAISRSITEHAAEEKARKAEKAKKDEAVAKDADAEDAD